MQYQIPVPKNLPLQGPTVQATDPIPPVSQPNIAAYSALQIGRYIVAVTQIYQGTIAAQTFPIPPVSQPETANFYPRYHVNRYTWEGPAQFFEGTTNQQTYVFSPNQPELSRFILTQSNRFQVEPIKRFEGLNPLTLGNFVFPQNQPDQIRFKNLHQNRYMVEPVKWFETRLAPQTYIFPVSNPVFNYYKPEINRYLWSSPGYIRVSPPGNPTCTITTIFSKQATASPIMPVAYLIQVNRRIASISPNTGQESAWQPPFNQ